MLTEIESVKRLSKDLVKAAETLSTKEARFLVDGYYILQQYRIEAGGQIREMAKTGEPHEVLQWIFAQSEVLENQIKRALDRWTDGQHMGRWSKAITGIGPVISAGLLAHIDIEKAPTVGHIWRFAGLDPTCKWLPKTKRPYNAELKTLCAFKLGESFVKVQNHERDIYGKVFAARKRLEEERNDAGLFKEQAAQILATKNFDKKTDAYKQLAQGRLPQAQIHARARRYAVKLFISHYHAEAYQHHFGKPAPLPYPIAFMGHAHFIDRPTIVEERTKFEE